MPVVAEIADVIAGVHVSVGTELTAPRSWTTASTPNAKLRALVGGNGDGGASGCGGGSPGGGRNGGGAGEGGSDGGAKGGGGEG
eukprot:456819-Prymnesium_polylepis.1